MISAPSHRPQPNTASSSRQVGPSPRTRFPWVPHTRKHGYAPPATPARNRSCPQRHRKRFPCLWGQDHERNRPASGPPDRWAFLHPGPKPGAGPSALRRRPRGRAHRFPPGGRAGIRPPSGRRARRDRAKPGPRRGLRPPTTPSPFPDSRPPAVEASGSRWSARSAARTNDLDAHSENGHHHAAGNGDTTPTLEETSTPHNPQPPPPERPPPRKPRRSRGAEWALGARSTRERGAAEKRRAGKAPGRDTRPAQPEGSACFHRVTWVAERNLPR